MSGGLHLDGLADTADALMAPDRMRAEAARKDPGVGSGGVVALVLVLAAQVAGLVSVMTIGGTAVAVVACIAAGAASRRSRSSSPGPVGDEAQRPDSAPGSSPASGRSIWPPRC